MTVISKHYEQTIRCRWWAGSSVVRYRHRWRRIDPTDVSESICCLKHSCAVAS